MCSPQLNAILVVDPNFIAVKKTDPLALLAAIKNVVTSRCDGNIELERAQALRDWYTLTIHGGEDVVAYGRRSVKLYHRLTSSGVPEPKISVTSIHRWTDQLEFDILRLQELPQQ
jgi:hypothetical protein